MRKLSKEDRIRIVACLTEGCSVRSTCRLTGFSKDTVLKLLADMGRVCQAFHDERVRNLRCERIQADEVWTFNGAKDRNIPEHRKGEAGLGSVWTWVGLDSDSKLVVSWYVGDRSTESAIEFMLDMASRILTRVQLTSDGHAAYVRAVWEAFGSDVDFAQLVKVYGAPREGEARYSPGVCLGCIAKPVSGRPIRDDVSTSRVERQNLTLRMSSRRFTRLTNAFSKKLENLCHSVSLHYCFYNWCRVHKTLRVTPAMESGLTDHVWEIAELVELLEASERKKIAAGSMKRGPYKKKGN